MSKRCFKSRSTKHIQLGQMINDPILFQRGTSISDTTLLLHWTEGFVRNKGSKIKVKFRWNNIMFNFIPLISWGNFGFWTCYSKYLSFPLILGRIPLNPQWWYLMTNKLATGELWIELAPCKFRKYLQIVKSEERPTLQLKFKMELKFIKLN